LSEGEESRWEAVLALSTGASLDGENHVSQISVSSVILSASVSVISCQNVRDLCLFRTITPPVAMALSKYTKPISAQVNMGVSGRLRVVLSGGYRHRV
jgi:hypothetical protein